MSSRVMSSRPTEVTRAVPEELHDHELLCKPAECIVQSTKNELEGIALEWTTLREVEASITAYPEARVRNIFSTSRINELLHHSRDATDRECTMECDSIWAFRTDTDSHRRLDFSQIAADFICILAACVLSDQTWLFFIFYELKLDDNTIAKTPLRRNDLNWGKISSRYDQWIAKRKDIRGKPSLKLLKFVSYQKELFFATISLDYENVQEFPPHLQLPFREIEQLGTGGYGKVFQAEFLLEKLQPNPDTLQGNEIAVKLYRDPLRGARDLETDTKSHLNFRHRYIIPLLASLSHRGRHMALFPKADYDLDHLLKNENPSSYDDKKVWKKFANLLLAVDHIHTSLEEKYKPQKLKVFTYHNDLKPGNILVRHKDDVWLLADLGMIYVKRATNEHEGIISKTKLRSGSAAYSPPGEMLGRGVDVWSMACIGVTIVAWLMGGPEAVRKFEEERRQDDNGEITLRFHDGRKIAKAVGDKLDEFADTPSQMNRGIAQVLRDMLEVEHGDNTKKQIKAKEAQNRIERLIGIQTREAPRLLAVPDRNNWGNSHGLIPSQLIDSSCNESHTDIVLREARGRAAGNSHDIELVVTECTAK